MISDIFPVSWFSKLMMWLRSLWDDMPDSVKEKIIDAIILAFEELFRQFYKQYNAEKGDSDA